MERTLNFQLIPHELVAVVFQLYYFVTPQRVPLSIHSYRGFNKPYYPRNLLDDCPTTYYDGASGLPVMGDWVMFTIDAPRAVLPTKVMIRKSVNWSPRYCPTHIRVHWGFHKHHLVAMQPDIENIDVNSDEWQSFDLDRPTEKALVALKNQNCKLIKLEILTNFGFRYSSLSCF